MVCFVFSCFLVNILIPGARQSTALFPDLKPGLGCPGGGDGGGDDDDDNDDDDDDDDDDGDDDGDDGDGAFFWGLTMVMIGTYLIFVTGTMGGARGEKLSCGEICPYDRLSGGEILHMTDSPHEKCE